MQSEKRPGRKRSVVKEMPSDVSLVVQPASPVLAVRERDLAIRGNGGRATGLRTERRINSDATGDVAQRRR